MKKSNVCIVSSYAAGDSRREGHAPFTVIAAVALLFFLLPAPGALALGVTEESDFRPVTGQENWSHEIPVEELEPGTYNLLIRAADEAGNYAYGGPINVEVDPESDIPEVAISTPREESVVGSRMVVLGTATDDDEISRVTVQLDDGTPVEAEGTEFWSASFDLSEAAEGYHTITAVSTDSNGLTSEPVELSFQYDGSGPAVIINTPESGSLATGTVRIEGTISDPNGLESLTVRRGPEGEEEELGVREGRPEDDISYRFDSEEEEDGPLVLWFTAADTTGSETQFPLLLFVDNTAPEILLFSPSEEEEIVPAGSVLFTGSVTDAVGVASLTYETSAGEEGELPLTPGDPFWSLVVPFAEGRRGSVEFTATDEAGNSSSLERDLELDEAADLPVIEDFRLTATHIFGEATDDDGVNAVEYAVDGGEWSRVETSRGFAIPLPDLPPGEHEVAARAVDLNDRTGPEVEGSITIAGEAPYFGGLEDGGAPFLPGRVIYEEEELLLQGSVSDAFAGSSLEYRINEGEWSSLRIGEGAGPGEGSFELALGRREEPGRHDLELRIQNSEGEGETLTSFYYLLQRLPEEPDPEETYLTEIPDDPGLYLSAGRLSDGLLRFRNERPLAAFVVGGDVAAARLEPPAEGFAVSVEDQNVLVTPEAPGRAENVALVVETEEGALLRSETLDLLYDVEPPEVEILSPEEESWVSGEQELLVSASDELEELTVEYALGDGEFTAMSLGDAAYVATIPAPAEEGAVAITVRATDGAGNTATVARSYVFDATAPAITTLTPNAETPVNGTISIVGRVDDSGPLEALRWSADGEEFEELEAGRFFSFPVDLTQYNESTDRPLIEAVDRAGNLSRQEMSFPIAVEEDLPVVTIQLPPPESVQREDFVISGTVFDDDGVEDIQVRIDDGEFQSVGAGDTFSFPVSIADIGDNEHTVTVRAIDVGGVQSEPVSMEFFVSLTNPTGSVSFPQLAESVRGRVVMSGTASDPNGISSVRLSFDNGSTFLRADPAGEAGLAEWQYTMESAALKDGLHAVQLEVTDGYGTESLLASLIHIDNTPPTVKLDLPGDGESYLGTLLLSGRVSDNQRLSEVAATITPRGGVEAAPVELPLELLAGGVLREEIDLSSLPAGSYNISVTARDESDNRRSLSRNVTVIASANEEERIELYSPFPGDELTGTALVEGRLFSQREFEQVVVRLDATTMGTAELDSRGFFSFALGAEALTEGEHTVSVSGEAVQGENLASPEARFFYGEFGPWVTVDSHRTGSAVSSRPTISGTAGYTFEDPADLEEGSREYRRALEAFEIAEVEVSLDDGATWEKASGREEWDYRIETSEVNEGWLPVLVRTTAENGERGYRRLQILVDTTPPLVTLDFPRASSRFNDVLLAAGSASDTNTLSGVEAILRQGSLARYEVPEFIQGLYTDFHFLGASTWDVGIGLTFFDQNVKLQGQFGYAPPGRFSGLVVGGKLLANVANFPFSYWFGPDYDFLSASLALGANFSYFSTEGLVLGGIVGQLEFPIVQNSAWRAFNRYSLYTEGQLWFISSDVQGGTEMKLSFGLRVQLL